MANAAELNYFKHAPNEFSNSMANSTQNTVNFGESSKFQRDYSETMQLKIKTITKMFQWRSNSKKIIGICATNHPSLVCTAVQCRYCVCYLVSFILLWFSCLVHSPKSNRAALVVTANVSNHRTIEMQWKVLQIDRYTHYTQTLVALIYVFELWLCI